MFRIKADSLAKLPQMKPFILTKGLVIVKHNHYLLGKHLRLAFRRLCNQHYRFEFYRIALSLHSKQFSK